MNKKNVKYSRKGDFMFAEWADRALDDEDRYNEDGTVIEVSAPICDCERLTKKRVNSLLDEAYDQWIRETRI